MVSRRISVSGTREHRPDLVKSELRAMLRAIEGYGDEDDLTGRRAQAPIEFVPDVAVSDVI